MRIETTLPRPHDNQRTILDSPALSKLVRAGRRFGKDRMALLASILGHGPVQDGTPLFPGIVHGVDIAWVGPDFPQVKAI